MMKSAPSVMQLTKSFAYRDLVRVMIVYHDVDILYSTLVLSCITSYCRKAKINNVKVTKIVMTSTALETVRNPYTRTQRDRLSIFFDAVWKD
jgi:hypothetical protein